MESLDARVFAKYWIPVKVVSKNLTVGDLVLVIDPDAPRRDWKLGLTEAVYPGKDGLVRVVDVRTKGVVKRRPISRLSPLESEEY